MAILLIGAAPGRAATTGTTYSNVQVFVHTTNSTFTGTYMVTAYNTTGYPLVTYQTPYPAASFELPSASYIFTVSATSNFVYSCPYMQGGVATGSTPPVTTGATGSATVSGGSSGGSPVVMPPCYSGYPQSEYGFATQQVSGATTVNINTQPVDKFSTTTVTVHVSYANGTAAAGTTVYASILGGDWYGVYGSSTLSMSGTVAKDGNVKLSVPAVPVDVTAWNWVPVAVPVSQTTVQVVIGGEKVNVAVNWYPNYVGLAGSVLIVPPQTSGSITLRVQQPDYWSTPYGVKTASSGVSDTSGAGATLASAPSSVPASVATQQAGGQSTAQTVVQTSTVIEQVPVTQELTAPAVSGGTNYTTALFTIVGALALAIACASLIMVRRRSDA